MIWFRGSLLISVALISGLMLGLFFSSSNLEKIEENRKFIFLNEGKSDIECRINEIYKESSMGNDYICTLSKLDSRLPLRDINILVKFNSSMKMKIGQAISFNSIIRKAVNPDGFDYESYLLLKGIYGTVNVYKFENLDKKINIVDSFIIRLKSYIVGILSKIYPGDSNKLLSGIFLGIRGDFSDELKTNFNRSGLSHIVAVSGYNITILIIFLSIVLRFFPDFLRILLILAGIIIFVLLVGNNSSAIRAAIMGIIAFLAMNYGRKINIYSVMVFTIILFILWNPLTINYDIGFHLSFLALLGLVCFGETFVKFLTFLPEKFSIKESIGTTLAVLLFTLPIMIVNFGAFSIISPISNLLATPLIPFIMLFGFISIIFYIIWPILGILVGYITYILLGIVLKIVQTLGNLSFSVINIDLGNWRYYFLIIYYIILIIAVSEIFYRSNSKSH